MRPLYHRLRKNLIDNLAKEEPHLFYWAPVAFGSGIALYFSLSFEPELRSVLMALLAVMIVTTLLYLQTKRSGMLWYRHIGLGILLIALGFVHIKCRSDQTATPQLRRTLSYVPFQGRIDQVERLSNGTRLTISGVNFLKTFRSDHPHPYKIRVTFKGHLQPSLDTMPGDYIQSIASLSPPSPPVTPRGYDFRRKAYFDGIGGVGYALAPVTPLDHGSRNDTIMTRIVQQMTKHRHQLSSYIQKILPYQNGAIMTALITGDRSGISHQTRDDFANAGLAHILAISGLHLSLVAGFIFFLIRGGLSAVPLIALRYHTKKIAAVVALFTTLLYLFISGMTIPAQRAFIMTALILLAVMTDRIALTLRNVALAALVVMLFKPDAIMGPSFQLSFAAVIALVAFYETYQKRLALIYTNLSESRFFLLKKGLFYGMSLITTSLIATLATLPLTIFTFNRFSLVAVLSNLLAIPLVSFIIMPFIVISMIGGPVVFKICAAVIGYGLEGLQVIATHASALPGSMILVPTVPVFVQIVCIFSLLWLTLMQAKWRYGALIPLIGSLVIIPFLPKPSFFIAADQALFGAYDDQTHQALISQKRRGSFARDNWLRSIGANSFKTLTLQPPFQNKYLYTPFYTIHIQEDQIKPYGRISHRLTTYFRDKNTHETILRITPAHIKTQGCHEFWLSPSGIRILTNQSETGARPWSLY